MFLTSICITIFAFVAESAFPNCMFARDPRWETPDGQTDGKSGVIPMGVCDSEMRPDNENSIYFACLPFGAYLFSFDVVDCVGEPSFITPLTSSDYSCTGGYCDVWKLRVSSATTDNCVLNQTEWQNVVAVKDICGMDNDASVMPQCDSGADTVTYNAYGTPDCSGDPIMALTDVVSGTCPPDPGNPTEVTYVELETCGQPSLPSAATTDCSYIVNPVYPEQGTNNTNNTRTKTGARPLSDVTNKICELSYRYDTYYDMGNGDPGYYRSRMWFCDEMLQLSFLAEWYDQYEPGCRDSPDYFTMIQSSEEFSCSWGNPCEYMHIRSSDISPNDTDQTCRFGANNGQFEANTMLTQKCWNDNDGGSPQYIMTDCVGSNLTYGVYTSSDCSGTAAMQIDMISGECITMNSLSYVQLVSCKGNSLAALPPDCDCVLNPQWNYLGTDGYQHQDNGNGYIPLNMCKGRMKVDDGGASSHTFVGMPWGAPYVLIWDSNSNCAGTPDKMYPVMYEDYIFDTGNVCATMNVVVSRTEDIDNACTFDVDNWEATNWVQNTCWNEADGGQLRSYMADCSSGITYTAYAAPDCSGGMIDQIAVNTNECSNKTADKNETGANPGMFFRLDGCGVSSSSPADTCSKIIAPSWNETYNNMTERKVRDIAAPLSSDICLTSYRKCDQYDNYCNNDGYYKSTMMWCSDYFEVAFVAEWMGTTCNGMPSFTSIIDQYDTLTCNNMVGGPCPYVTIRTAAVNETIGAGYCSYQYSRGWEESAVLIDECWESCEDTNDDNILDTCALLYVQCDADQIRYVEYDTSKLAACNSNDFAQANDNRIIDSDDCVSGLGVGNDDESRLMTVLQCSDPDIPTIEPTASPVTSDPSASPVTATPTENPTEFETTTTEFDFPETTAGGNGDGDGDDVAGGSIQFKVIYTSFFVAFLLFVLF